MAIMIISGDSIFVHLNTLFVSNLREMNSLFFFFLGHKSTRSEMGQCFISSALILARGSSGLLFMLVKELRILEQLCARVWEPLHYLR